MIHSISKPDITIRQAIKDAIDEGFNEQTEFLSEFVRIPSLRFQEGTCSRLYGRCAAINVTLLLMIGKSS